MELATKEFMKSLLIGIGFILAVTACSIKQKVDSTEQQAIPIIRSPYSHQVMILGFFHFDRGLDGSDVVARNHLDIADPENQIKINDLVNTIVNECKPTFIAAKWMPEKQAWIDSLYHQYMITKKLPGRNEAFQLRFRIAEKLNLSTLERLLGVYAANTSLRLVNSEANLKRAKQLWFTGLVNLGHGDKYVGADLTGHWYRRHRIFVNIRNLAKQNQGQILVIYGMGHKWIMEELFQGSPEFEVVSTFKVLM